MTDRLEPTQADIERAKEWFSDWCGPEREDLPALFARHALASIEQLQAEYADLIMKLQTGTIQLQAENDRLRAFRDAMFGGRRSDLSNIIRAIEDEGDRAYFGSTNDADELRAIVHWLEDQERRTALEGSATNVG